MTAVEEAVPAFAQAKIVEKVFSLPLVSDTYYYGRLGFVQKIIIRIIMLYITTPPLPLSSSPGLSTVSSLASPLQPLLASISTVVDSLMSLREERPPEVAYTGLNLSRDQVINLL